MPESLTFEENAQQARIASVRAAVETVARSGYGKLVAFLASRTRDLSAAEDAVSEAFAAALTDWPRNGIPQNPEAWLLTVARRKLIDLFRTSDRQQPASDLLENLSIPSETSSSSEIPDERLAMLFACAHPAVDAAMHAPLMLQAVLGLDATRISSAFLISPAAMAKRLVRAKDKIRQAAIPIRVPGRDELPDRLDAVLNAIYGAFSAGWTDPTGLDEARRGLNEESLFLANLVADLLPAEPEALGLFALMLNAESRRRARRSPSGDFVPLAQQDQALWDQDQITKAESQLTRAGAMGRIGRFQLEAALQSAHIARCRTGQNNWPQIVALYDALLAITDSTVVAINRAVAVAECDGASAGLAALPLITADTRLNQYQPYWVARAELLARTGDFATALEANEIAIGLERDPAVRRFLESRRAEWTH